MILLLDDSSYTYTLVLADCDWVESWKTWDLQLGASLIFQLEFFWPLLYYIASTSYHQSESSHILANWIFIADTQLPPSWSPPHNPASHWQKEKFSLSFCQEDLKHETMLIDCTPWHTFEMESWAIEREMHQVWPQLSPKGRGGWQKFSCNKAGLVGVPKRLFLIGRLGPGHI